MLAMLANIFRHNNNQNVVLLTNVQHIRLACTCSSAKFTCSDYVTILIKIYRDSFVRMAFEWLRVLFHLAIASHNTN